MLHLDAPPEDLVEAIQAALDEGEPLAALELCQRYLSHAPDSPLGWFLEAEILRELREAAEAEVAYRRSVTLAPQHARAWAGLASALYDQHRFDDALTAAQRALRLDPDDADAWYCRALVREQRGDDAGARRAYLRAWSLSPSHPPPSPMTSPQLREAITEAALPDHPAVAAWLHQTPIVVLELPDEDVCDAYEPPASPADVLAHFAVSAPPAPHRRTSASMPPTLLVYRRNMERYAGDRDELLALLRASIVPQIDAWLDGAATADA